MKSLIIQIEKLKESEIKKIVDERLNEFREVRKDFNSLFRELVFCILTAGTSAELGIKTMDHLGDTIFTGEEKEIQEKLKEVYRFHTIRAGYIHKAREKFQNIDVNHSEIRDILVDEIKGLGLKEASHFLRNVGFDDYAIVDFHIVDILDKHKIIEKPKTMTPKKYLEIEEKLRELAKLTNTTLAELDLYLWYLETGKVLK